jgi:hypothetical protein
VNRLRTDERGGILVLSAVLIPLFLLMTALVVDGGNWFTHKRQLQNRADAGALAAGVEYLSQLQNCVTSPGTTGVAIGDVAKRYAGTEDAGVTGTKFNQHIANPATLSVAVNATSATAADSSDGGGPCTDHDPGDSISPGGGYWTDVKVREQNLSTMFGGFGLNLPSVSAQARVEVKQLIGVRRGGLPLVNETGDQVDCVWAQFVDTITGATSGILAAGASNPVALSRDPTNPRHWTANVPDGIDITSNRDDIAVQYWMGMKTGAACDFSTDFKALVPDLPVNWINVYNDDSPVANAAPFIHHFVLSPGTCGPDQVTFITSPVTCNINFSVEVDKGVAANTYPTSITVDIENPSPENVATGTPASPTLTSVTVNGGGPYYTGQITLNPNELSSRANFSQDYTQVGRHRLRVRWSKTTGRIGATLCTPAAPCTGTFLSEQPSNWQHAVYVADPLNSSPMSSAELVSGGSPIQNSWAAGGPDTGGFEIDVNLLGVDQSHMTIVRQSVQASGNRTLTVDCGQGGGTNALRDAFEDGCPVPLTVNQRGDSCTPNPPLASGAWDCVNTVPGNRNATRQGLERRFQCSMANNWNGSSPGNLSDNDPRYAYIFLTNFARAYNVGPNNWIPIKAFLRIYVQGWDKAPNSYETCGGANPNPPRGYDANGAQLWGYFVDVITLNDDVIPGDPECDLSVSLVTCKPVLVR